MQLVKVMPEMNRWRTQVKLAEIVNRAHDLAKLEYDRTNGVGYKKFAEQKALALAESTKRKAEEKAKRILFLESKRKVLAEKAAALNGRELTRWAWRKGPRVEVKTGLFLPVIGVLRIYAEVAEVK